MKEQQAILLISISATMALAAAVVTAQWWIVMGVPLQELDPVIYLLPNLLAVVVGSLFARLWANCRMLERAVRRSKDREGVLETRGFVLKRENRDLVAFARTLVHDLRSPISVVRGFSEELLESHPPNPGVVSDRLTRINRSARRMDSILNGLMRLANVQRMPMSVTPVDVSQLAQEIVDGLSDSDPASDVSVEIQPDMQVRADRAMFEVALSNLLSNAWKFTKGRQAPTVHIGQQKDGVIRVKDNGVGFDQKRATEIFKPFRRCHSKDEFEGSGIGLATVKQVVDRHGGRVWAEGHPGQGACFFLDMAGRRREKP